MPRPLSVDLRQRLVTFHKATSVSREELGAIFGVGPATAYRWVVEAKDGKLEPGKAPGAAPLISAEQFPSLRALVEMRNDATLQDLCDAWERMHGVRVSVTTMHHVLTDKLGITRKKRRSARPSKTGKTSSPSDSRTRQRSSKNRATSSSSSTKPASISR